MSQLFGFAGSDDFYSGASICSSNPKDQTLFLPLGHHHHVDLYYPSRKRSRVTVPFLFDFEQKKQTSIDVLPDECLFEVFRRLEGQERSASACVSRRWLGLLSSIRRDELSHNDAKDSETVSESESESDGGYLSRSLEGKKATDVRLLAIAVGTNTRGGLGKLSVRGSRKVTNLGIRAVGRCCGSLKVLSLWNLASVGDEGLAEIGEGCHQLEKLDLCQCPGITDKGLKAIAVNCPNLTDLTIESCANISNEGLQAIGRSCPDLKSVSIKNCPAVGDQGISGLVSSSLGLAKVKLQSLNITDVSLAVIGHYGKSVTDLVLTSLPNVTERGFWVMGNGHGLQKLKTFVVTSCIGATDVGLEAVAKGCPNLKQFRLGKCAFLSDNGLVAFVKSSAALESLQLEECHRITQFGFFGSLLNCGTKLKSVSLANCLGIKDLDAGVCTHGLPCESLRSLSVSNCPGFGDGSLSFLGKLCPQLQNLELTGLQGATDSGLLELLRSCKSGLVKVNLSGCVNLSDRIVVEMSEQHGWTLEKLSLEGCAKITDASLAAVAKGCLLLSDLDVSRCSITDAGIAALASSGLLGLQVFSVSGCHMVSDKSFTSLMQLGQTLLGLSLQQCNAISSSTVELLVERLWRCDVLC
ncbi:EIN3-binding F-box protein 1 [Linum grandiflorum]